MRSRGEGFLIIFSSGGPSADRPSVCGASSPFSRFAHKCVCTQLAVAFARDCSGCTWRQPNDLLRREWLSLGRPDSALFFSWLDFPRDVGDAVSPSGRGPCWGPEPARGCHLPLRRLGRLLRGLAAETPAHSDRHAQVLPICRGAQGRFLPSSLVGKGEAQRHAEPETTGRASCPARVPLYYRPLSRTGLGRCWARHSSVHDAL